MRQKMPSSNAALPKHIHSQATSQISGKIKVAIHIPVGIAENLKQQKINRIYDILNPEISQ